MTVYVNKGKLTIIIKNTTCNSSKNLTNWGANTKYYPI